MPTNFESINQDGRAKINLDVLIQVAFTGCPDNRLELAFCDEESEKRALDGPNAPLFELVSEKAESGTLK